MKKSFLRILIILSALWIAMPCSTYAQQAQVKAALDTNIVEFGSPARLTIGARVRSGQTVVPPSFRNNQIMPTLEVLYEEKTDTLKYDSGEVTYVFHYQITSFEDSLYMLPSFAVLVDGDTLKTTPLPIRFISLQDVDSSFLAKIDTTQTVQIFDVKDLKETPLTFAEFWARFGNYILIGLIAALVAALITYIVIRKMRNKPIIPISKPKEPAEKVAFRRLAQLKDKKLCEQEKTKEYYSELTEILKTYISDRYGTSVLESTSAETLEVLKKEVGKKSDAYSSMEFIFDIADFVKFAKMQPLPDENAKSMDLAYGFVESTKPVVVVQVPENAAPNAPKEKE